MLDKNALTIENLRKEYPGTLALDDVSFSVKKGTIHGFLGPNGAGKSTTMKIIAGLIPASSGQVSFGHSNLRVGFLPEHPPLYQNMKVRDFLKFVQDLYTLKSFEKKELLDKVIEECGLKNVQGRLISHLSKGFKQRVGMAQSLVHGAEFVIFDEPIVGLDPHAIEEARKLIIELRKEHTILLSTHQLAELGRICDEATFIDNGRVIKSGRIEDLGPEQGNETLIEATLLSFERELEESIRPFIASGDLNIQSLKEKILISFSIEKSEEVTAKVTQILAKSGKLVEFKTKERSLEDLFKEFVQ